MPVVVIAEITHLSKHDTVAEEGLAICPHMSSFVSIYLRLSQSGDEGRTYEMTPRLDCIIAQKPPCINNEGLNRKSV